MRITLLHNKYDIMEARALNYAVILILITLITE